MVEHRNIIRGTRFYFAKLVATQEISKFFPLSGCRAASHGEEEGYPKCLSCTGLKYQDTERSIPIGSMLLLYMVTCTINIPHFC